MVGLVGVGRLIAGQTKSGPPSSGVLPSGGGSPLLLADGSDRLLLVDASTYLKLAS